MTAAVLQHQKLAAQITRAYKGACAIFLNRNNRKVHWIDNIGPACKKKQTIHYLYIGRRYLPRYMIVLLILYEIR